VKQEKQQQEQEEEEEEEEEEQQQEDQEEGIGGRGRSWVLLEVGHGYGAVWPRPEQF
jgi:hypothetical protein